MTSKFFKIAILAFAAGLGACSEVTAPQIAPDYLVTMDTTTMSLGFAVGDALGLELQAIATGQNIPDGFFEYVVDRPKMVSVTVERFTRSQGFSPESGAPTVIFDQIFDLTAKAEGVVKVTIWHPADPRKKKVLIMTIGKESLPAGCTSRAGFSPTTGLPCSGGVG